MNFLKEKMSNLLLLLAIIFTSNIFASAGGRGGGTGVLCKNSPPIMLEEYELNKEMISIQIPTKRSRVRNFIKEKLFENPSLFGSWEKIWKKNKRFNRWDLINSKGYRYSSQQVTNSFFFNDIALVDNPVEGDEYVELRDECKKVQISLFLGNKVFRAGDYDRLLSEQTKRFAEIHEAFYILGTKEFGHLFSFKTRNLIKALNENNTKNLKEAISNFIKKPNKVISRGVNLYRLTEEDDRIYFLGPYQGQLQESFLESPCPEAFVLIAESEKKALKIDLHDVQSFMGKISISKASLSNNLNLKVSGNNLDIFYQRQEKAYKIRIHPNGNAFENTEKQHFDYETNLDENGNIKIFSRAKKFICRYESLNASRDYRFGLVKALQHGLRNIKIKSGK